MATVVHLVAALVVVLVVAAVGRVMAARLRQPPVIGEVSLGLLLVPALTWVGGADLSARLLPAPVLGALLTIAEAALALFLVGMVADLGLGGGAPAGRALRLVVVGGLLPSVVAGLALGWWILAAAPPAIRGSAPGPALVVFLAAVMGVTAVPVLARILGEWQLAGTRTGGLALGAAVATDVVCWIGLTVALALAAGVAPGWPTWVSGLAVCAVLVPLVRRALRTPAALRFAGNRPVASAALLGLAAIGGGLAGHAAGVSMLIGSLGVALAVPTSPMWADVARSVGRVGAYGVPVFFVGSGTGISVDLASGVPWLLTGVVLIAGTITKIGGGWAGARLAGEDHGTALRVGILLNTRGMTELVMLQIGAAAGIQSTSLFLALAIMAVVSTACTGPLLILANCWSTFAAGPSRSTMSMRNR